MAAGSLAASGASRQPGTAAISGTVFEAATRQPIAGATVVIYGSPLDGGRRSTTSGPEGRYTFADLPSGRYTVSVSKPGLLTIAAGQRRYSQPGKPLALRGGDALTLDLFLPTAGSIAGEVVDERKQPMRVIPVRAWRITLSSGYPRPMDAGNVVTDASGTYRIANLQPGDYLVCAYPKVPPLLTEAQSRRAEIDRMRREAASLTGPSAEAMQRMYAAQAAELEAALPGNIEPVLGYAPACFPGTSTALGTVAVGPGDDRAGVDFQFAPTRLARVEGTLTGAIDPSIDAHPIRLFDPDTRLQVDFTRPGPDGRFMFPNVPPGRYQISVQGGRGKGPGPLLTLASLDIEVADRDLAGLVLQAQRPASVSGRVVFAGRDAPPPELIARLQARAEPSSRRFADTWLLRTASVDAEGRFTIADVFPGRYELSALLQGESGWFLQSVAVSGREMMNQSIDLPPGDAVDGVELVYDDRVAEVTGTVLDAAGEPATQVMVLLYQRGRPPVSGRFRAARPEPDGRYALRGMLPGDYRLAVVWDYEFGAWFDPAFLRAADRAAISITIGERQRKTQDLRAP